MAGTFGFQNVVTPFLQTPTFPIHSKLSLHLFYASNTSYYQRVAVPLRLQTIIFIIRNQTFANQTIALISHAGQVMLKILQASLQQYINREVPDVQSGFRRDRVTRD